MSLSCFLCHYFFLLFVIVMPVDTPPKRSSRSGSNTAPLNLNDIKTLIDNVRKEIINTLKDEVGALRSTIDKLKTTVSELQSENKELTERCISVEAQLHSYSRTLMSDISDEIENRAHRSKNIVISGVPESSPDSSKDEAAKEDATLSTDILKTLGFKENTIGEVRRIGKPNEKRPRLLRVTCISKEVRDDILRRAKELRRYSRYRGFFINPDRTPFQQKCWSELLSELKTRRDIGEDVVIFRDRVVPRRRNQNFQHPF